MAVVARHETAVLLVRDFIRAHPRVARERHLASECVHVAPGGDAHERKRHAPAEVEGADASARRPYHWGKRRLAASGRAPYYWGKRRPAASGWRCRRVARECGRSDLRHAVRALVVLLHVRIAALEVGATRGEVVHAVRADRLVPGAVSHAVEVDPRVDAVPRLRVEPHAVVSALQHLHERGGVRRQVARREERVVPFLRVAAHVGAELDVAWREEAVVQVVDVLRLDADIGTVREVRLREPTAERRAGGRLTLAVVALHAVAVEDGLHLAAEVEAALGSVPGLDLARRALHGDEAAVRPCARLVLLVAAAAGGELARHRLRPAAHELKRAALLVKRLDGDRHVRRNLEVRAAVRLHRHGAEDALDVPGAVQPVVVGLAAHPAVGEGVGVEAEGLHGAARHALQSGAVVDVGDLHEAIPRAGLHLRCDDGRNGGGLQRRRLEVDEIRLLDDWREVVEGVGEVESPAVLLRGTRRHEHVVLRERPGVAELRPRVVGEAVAHDGLHLLPALGETLHHAVGPVATAVHVEEHELAVARVAVVSGHGGDEAVGVVGAHARVEERVRPVAVAAVPGALLRTVGVHREEDARAVVRDVGVFPVEEHHAAVGHHVRTPVVVLVEREAADGAVRLAPVEAPHPARTHHTRHAHHRRVGDEDRRAVGQVTTRVAVDVRVGDVGEFARVRARLGEVALEHAVDALHRTVAADLRRMVDPVRTARVHHAATVPVQAQLADIAVVRRGFNHLECGFAAQAGNNAELVRAAGRVARLLPVVVEAEAVGTPPHREDAVAIEKRICEQVRAQVGEELLRTLKGRQLAVVGTPVALDRGKNFLAALLERAQPLGLRLEAVRPAPRHVRPREAHVLDLHRLQAAEDALRAVLAPRRQHACRARDQKRQHSQTPPAAGELAGFSLVDFHGGVSLPYSRRPDHSLSHPSLNVSLSHVFPGLLSHVSGLPSFTTPSPTAR